MAKFKRFSNASWDTKRHVGQCDHVHWPAACIIWSQPKDLQSILQDSHIQGARHPNIQVARPALILRHHRVSVSSGHLHFSAQFADSPSSILAPQCHIYCCHCNNDNQNRTTLRANKATQAPFARANILTWTNRTNHQTLLFTHIATATTNVFLDDVARAGNKGFKNKYCNKKPSNAAYSCELYMNKWAQNEQCR